eukprot:scaffold98179_cov19-Tisochrysis_lutea.AAC.2
MTFTSTPEIGRPLMLQCWRSAGLPCEYRDFSNFTTLVLGRNSTSRLINTKLWPWARQGPWLEFADIIAWKILVAEEFGCRVLTTSTL